MKNNVAFKSLLLLLLFIMIVWLIIITRYKYLGDSSRFDNLKGTTELLSKEGEWKSFSLQASEKVEKEIDLITMPDSVIAKISAKATYNSYGKFTAEVSNLSRWKINEIDFEISMPRQTTKYTFADGLTSVYRDSLVIKRFFTGTSYSDNEGTPLSIISYSKVLPAFEESSRLELNIVSARGEIYTGQH